MLPSFFVSPNFSFASSVSAGSLRVLLDEVNVNTIKTEALDPIYDTKGEINEMDGEVEEDTKND